MKIKRYFLLGTLLLTLTSFSFINSNEYNPILTRHDKEDAEFFKIAERFEKYICHLSNEPHCEGTVIADQWVITAAHCVNRIQKKLKAGEMHCVVINGVEIEVDKVITYNKFGIRLADMALLHLKEKPIDAMQAELYVDNDEVDKLVYFVGEGYTGNGLIGVAGNDRKLRGVTNRVEKATEKWIKFTFDKPGTPTKYLTEYEGISGPGDSGGPAFILKNDKVYLAGISSKQLTKGGAEGLYGVEELYTRISTKIDWIREKMKENE